MTCLKLYSQVVTQFSEYFWGNSHVSDIMLSLRENQMNPGKLGTEAVFSGETAIL